MAQCAQRPQHHRHHRGQQPAAGCSCRNCSTCTRAAEFPVDRMITYFPFDADQRGGVAEVRAGDVAKAVLKLDFDHHSPRRTPIRSRTTRDSARGARWGHRRTRRLLLHDPLRRHRPYRPRRRDVLLRAQRYGGPGVSIVIPKGHGLEQYPIELDPTASVDYRELINPLLTPAAVDALAPMIAAARRAHRRRLHRARLLRLRPRPHQSAAGGGDAGLAGFPRSRIGRSSPGRSTTSSPRSPAASAPCAARPGWPAWTSGSAS